MFVLSLVFFSMMVLMFFRTCGRMCSRGSVPWKVFYSVVWVNVILTCVTYITLSGAMFETPREDKNFYRMFALIFVPTIMQTLIYAGIYWALEKTISEGKLRVGGSLTRLQTDKCAACFKITTFVFVMLFTIAELVFTGFLAIN